MTRISPTMFYLGWSFCFHQGREKKWDKVSFLVDAIGHEAKFWAKADLVFFTPPRNFVLCVYRVKRGKILFDFYAISSQLRRIYIFSQKFLSA